MVKNQVTLRSPRALFEQISDNFAFVVDRLTSYTTCAVVEHFEDIDFCGVDRDLPALRAAIREAVIENLMATLRDAADENAVERDVVARLRVATTREMLVELFTEKSANEQPFSRRSR